MKTTSIVILSAVALAVVGLCCAAGGFGTVVGSGRVVEKTYEVSDFTSVDMSVPGKLTIEIGEEEALRVEAEDNLFEYFEIEVREGVLEIKSRPMVWMWPTKPINLCLTVKRLDAIAVSGSGEVEAPALEAEQFSVRVSGSGAVDMESLKADALTVRISGSGRLNIAGGTDIARKHESPIGARMSSPDGVLCFVVAAGSRFRRRGGGGGRFRR